MDRACELMQNRTLKDRQIAGVTGRCDEFYFSRRFKSVTGQSPRQPRRRSCGDSQKTHPARGCWFTIHALIWGVECLPSILQIAPVVGLDQDALGTVFSGARRFLLGKVAVAG